MRRRLAAIGGAVALALAVEGAFLARVPGAVVHVLYLPALYAGRWSLGALVALGLLEWGLGRVPLGAAMSTVATVWFVVVAIREELNVTSPVLAVAALPLIEIVRQFWLGVFASLYAVGRVPELPLDHTAAEAVAALGLWALWRQRPRRPARGELTAW